MPIARNSVWSSHTNSDNPKPPSSGGFAIGSSGPTGFVEELSVAGIRSGALLNTRP